MKKIHSFAMLLILALTILIGGNARGSTAPPDQPVSYEFNITQSPVFETNFLFTANTDVSPGAMEVHNRDVIYIFEANYNLTAISEKQQVTGYPLRTCLVSATDNNITQSAQIGQIKGGLTSEYGILKTSLLCSYPNTIKNC